MKKINVVGAVIYDKGKDKFLITMRDKSQYVGGLWRFPGGKIEEGESNEEALKREIKQKLGCKIKIHKFLMDYTYNYPRLAVRLITYLCTIDDEIPEFTEHESMRWVSKKEIEELNFSKADRPTVDMIILNAATL